MTANAVTVKTGIPTANKRRVLNSIPPGYTLMAAESRPRPGCSLKAI
jgi:hypothetical protein